jgi:hypothetical protein
VRGAFQWWENKTDRMDRGAGRDGRGWVQRARGASAGGGELERCRASGLVPGKRWRASAVQGFRLAVSGVRLCADLQGALRNRRREECGLNMDPEPAKVQARGRMIQSVRLSSMRHLPMTRELARLQ